MRFPLLLVSFAFALQGLGAEQVLENAAERPKPATPALPKWTGRIPAKIRQQTLAALALEYDVHGDHLCRYSWPWEVGTVGFSGHYHLEQWKDVTVIATPMDLTKSDRKSGRKAKWELTFRCSGYRDARWYPKGELGPSSSWEELAGKLVDGEKRSLDGGTWNNLRDGHAFLTLHLVVDHLGRISAPQLEKFNRIPSPDGLLDTSDKWGTTKPVE